MIVPAYWAEARVQHRRQGRQITIRRFGWSDSSQADAQALAEQRAGEALALAVSGEPLPRREPKIPYNGAHGVPIREQIVSRHDQTVITRNSYGALCLNTPDVLFADIDFGAAPSWRLVVAVGLLGVLGAAAGGWYARHFGVFFFLFLLALVLSAALPPLMLRAVQALHGGAEGVARDRIRRFCAQHPQWNLRIYRTPSGLRVLATHQLFDPLSVEVAQCFQALGTDPVYVAMCRNQRCFRARLSAKPWRIGIPGHLKPRPGVWPVAPEKMPEREAWLAHYDSLAAAFAACHFVETVGSGVTHPQAQQVQDLHDNMSGALGTLPTA